MDKKIKFEFDLDEVFDGIEKGVIKQMSEMTFDGIVSRGQAEFQKRLDKELEFSFEGVRKIKEEVVSKAVEKLTEKLKENILKKQEENIMIEVSKALQSYKIKDRMEDLIENVEDKIVRIQLSKKPKVEITREEYEEMQKRLMLLDALESGGVDNWEGYEWSIEDAKKSDKEFRKVFEN